MGDESEEERSRPDHKSQTTNDKSID